LAASPSDDLRNQGDLWPTELTESKGDMYPMMYQELVPIAAMAIDRGVDMIHPNIKKLPQGEGLEHNDGRTRRISGQQS
jgi:hypothetical protein